MKRDLVVPFTLQKSCNIKYVMTYGVVYGRFMDLWLKRGV